MATVELTPVLIHYSVTPESIIAQVRTYAGAFAIEERAHTMPLGDAKAITPADVCALVPVEGVIWGGDDAGLALRQADPIFADIFAAKAAEAAQAQLALER